MRHEPEEVEGVEICRDCHLVMPCMDGRILAYRPRKDNEHWFSVREIMLAIELKDEWDAAA